jgi:hypothetical protein
MIKSSNNTTLPDILPTSQRISPIDNTIIDSLTISSQLLNILEKYTFEGIEISPNGYFIITEQPTYHNHPGPIFIIELKNNKVYETNLIVQKFDMGTAEIQRWDASGNIYCKSIYGQLHFIDLKSKKNYCLSSANYHLLGGIFSPNKKYFALLYENKKTTEDFVSVIKTELLSFLK